MMTPEQAEWCIGRTVLLQWPESESAVAHIIEIDNDYLVSDEGLGFRIEAMGKPSEVADTD